MFDIKAALERFGMILAQMDTLAADHDSEALDDLNAEFEDALLMLGELDPRDGDFNEELADAMEELRALARDYEILSEGLPDVAGPARQLRSAAALDGDGT